MRLLVLLGVVSQYLLIAEGEGGAKCLNQTCYCVNGTMHYSCLYRSGFCGDLCETAVDAKENNKDNDEARLQKELFKRYNPELRPVMNKTDAVTIWLGVSLHQIINVDEKNQLVKISIWVRQAWFNPYLTWNPSDYGGIAQTNINANKAWKPDIYLYNNADEGSDGALDRFKTKIVLSSNGRNMWLAPVLYTFSCKFDVNFFPFDEQLCPMKFGSWTYDGYRLDVQMEAENGETKMYVSNGEWDLVGLPAQRNEITYMCCPEPYPDVTFTVHIRRRTMFYYINLIVPCALITSLSLLSFFLPPDSGERITLVITNLLAMTVFMLIVAEIMPATSEVIPLISIYYTGIMFEVALSLVATCMVLKCYYKNPSISEMPMWVRSVVLNKLAKIVRVQVPQGLKQNMEKHVKDEKEAKEEIEYERCNSILPPPLGRRESCVSYNGDLMTRARSITTTSGRNRAATLSTEKVSLPHENAFDPDATSTVGAPRLMRGPDSLFSIDEEEAYVSSNPQICKQKASFEVALNDLLIKQHSILKNVRRLVNEIRRKKEEEIKKEEWKIVAAIIDACFFWLFMLVLIISSVVIFLQAPQY